MTKSPASETDLSTPVSIVIPTCNRDDVLARCLASLAGQNYRNFEIVIIDDASTDTTPQIIEQFQPERSDIRVIRLRNETQAGANPSRNRGINAASGRIIAFLDSDCIAEPTWLERLIIPIANDSTNRVAGVCGLVHDAPARSIFDTTFKGTHRIHGATDASRFIGCNMCVRRDLLVKYRFDEDRSQRLQKADGTPDVSVSGRGDEEGLYLVLRAAGYVVKTAPDAAVIHEHFLGGRAFFRQAFRGGRSAARLVYKFGLPQRIDMLPFMLALVTLPLGFIRAILFAIPAICFLAGLAAITYNDLIRKKKSLTETIMTYPLLIAYYLVRLAGYLAESVRLRITRHDVSRVRLSDFARDKMPASRQSN